MNDHNDSTEPRTQVDVEVERELNEALGDADIESLMDAAANPPPADTPEPSSDQAGVGSEPERLEMNLVRGRIVAVRGEDVFVDLHGMDAKNQGVVPLQQFEHPPRVGSIMDFVIQRQDPEQGLVFLSREGAVSRVTWDHIQRGTVVEARVVAKNKGGLELELIGRIRAFMPASQVDRHHVDDLESLVGQKLHATVQDVDRRARKVVLSRRQYLEHQHRVQLRKVLDELEVGQVRQGVVRSLTTFGAFVDLGGVDGLVHVSDMSYSRVASPGEVVSVGQTVTVKVLQIDPAKKRISLGMKQAAPDPWEGIDQRLHEGQEVSGRVTRTADFGAFVELEAGVEGLVPISELSWRHVRAAGDVVKPGDEVQLIVLKVEPERRRVSLSLKRVQGDPWVGVGEKYAQDSLVEAAVARITDFGAFLELEQGVEGLVHISELADRRVHRVEDVLSVGQKAQFRVIGVDEDHHRIRLSLKAVHHSPESHPERRHDGPDPATRRAHKSLGHLFRRPGLDQPSGRLKGGIE